MNLCIKCCENVKKLDGECWRDVCKVTGVRIEDSAKSWDEGSDPLLACDTYRGPIGFDFSEWSRKFEAALAKAIGLAIDEGTVRQSEIVRAFCK